MSVLSSQVDGADMLECAEAQAARVALDPLDIFDIRGLLNEEQRMVQDSVGRFVADNVLPIIQRHFENHTFPHDLIAGIADLGLLGASMSGYGCSGIDAISYGLICQELERGDSGIRSFVSVQSSLCMYPIFAYGSETQKQKYLPRMAQAKLIGCFGLSETHGGKCRWQSGITVVPPSILRAIVGTRAEPNHNGSRIGLNDSPS